MSRGGPPSGLELLKQVLVKRRDTPDQKKLVGDKYQPFYGITCVLHLRNDCFEAWGKLLYQRLAADPIITNVMALLPPESYHVTLRGLEPCIELFSSPEEMFLKLKAAQDSLNRLTKDKPIIMLPQISSRLGSFNLSSPSNSQESLLRSGEELLLGLLPDEQSQRMQKWHLSLGYNIGKPPKSALKAAHTALTHHINVMGLPQLHVITPEICVYESMEHFKPLFT